MRKIIEFMLGTSILWLPIVGCLIADWLSQIITMDMIITVVYISIPILIIILIVCEIADNKVERRNRQYGTKR